MNTTKTPRIIPLSLAGAVTLLMAVNVAPQPTPSSVASRTDEFHFIPVQHAVLHPPKTGRELYREACATCHGADGTGAPKSQVGFDAPLPDFTSCNFATREPDADWIAVAHQGGPVRGFSQRMPAFGDALTQSQLQKIMNYIRSLCPDDDWPRGELNLPRPLTTEKAYPEDEAVLTTTVDVENEGVE